jgi:hypothetical protein
MYWEIDARSENLVKNGVIRCRGERVSAPLQLRLVSAYRRLAGPLPGKTESADLAESRRLLTLERLTVSGGAARSRVVFQHSLLLN